MMSLKNICVIGAGMMGRSFMELCRVNYPDLTLHVFDNDSDALTKIKQSNTHTYTSLSQLQEQANQFVFCACPWSAFVEAVETFEDANRMIVGIARPPSKDEWTDFTTRFAYRKDLIIPCIGIEPGLSEIILANMLDQEEKWKSIEIQCGGLVLPIPKNPLKYKRLFGDLHLPFDWKKAYLVEQGQIVATERFSGLESLKHELGELECYHDGLRVPLIEHPALQDVKTITQKTIRWKGHIRCLKILKEFGLLNSTNHPKAPSHTPKRFFEILNQKQLSLHEKDKTLSILQIIATNHSNEAQQLSIHFKDVQGQNSMAIATNLPGLFLIEHYAELITAHNGIFLAEKIIRGSLYQKLLAFLSSYQAEVKERSEFPTPYETK
jgi:saccharopine dehydrogenase-like NADP-dependent oxidoreductase